MVEDDIVEDVDVIIKVIVLGNGGVGKTSLSLRYAKSVFTNEYKKTVGVDFLQKKKFIKSVEREVEFNIWDTAGQENFDSVTKRYYRGAQAVIYVFSTTDRESFLDIPKWKEKVLDLCDKSIPMILVMNKIDVSEEDKKVTADEAIKLAASVEMYLFKTSVKDDIKVNEIFDTIAFDFFNKAKVKVAQMDDISHVVNNKNNKDKEIKEVKVEPQKKGTDVPSRKEDKNDGFKINKQNDNKKKNKKDGCC